MPWCKPDGTIVEHNVPSRGWGEHAMYKLNPCKCGATQEDGNLITAYGGAGSFGAWFALCRQCGARTSDAIEAVAVEKWNRGEMQ